MSGVPGASTLGMTGAWDPAPHDAPPGYRSWTAEPTPTSRRPRYRERGPVRWWGVLIGVGVTLVYFVLVGILSWSPASLVGTLLAAVLVASSVAGVLLNRGDRGIGVGVATVTGAALSVAILVLAWGVFDLGG